MSENKQYFWLRLKKDFFKRHDIQIIESMPDGKEYVLFYLKLLCESIDHNGMLRFSDEIPYSEDMLATITNTDKQIAYDALGHFFDLGMVEILEDGTFYLKQVENMIGQAEQDEHTRESTRKRVKAFRERQKQSNNSETLPKRYSNVTCNGEIEKEKEIEIEIEKEIDKRINYQEIIDLYNDICMSFPRLKSLSEARKKAIRARLKTYSVDDFRTMFEKAEASSFLKGANDRNWSACFDWMVKDSNMAKILDGNYDNKGHKTDSQKTEEYLKSWEDA